MSPRRGGPVLRMVSRLSMLSGVALFAAGMTIRAGVFAPAAGAAGPLPTSSPVAVISAASNAPTVVPTVAIAATPTIAPTPAPATTAPVMGEVLFADDFMTETAWPVGPVAGANARYENGTYVLDAQPIDLPGYVLPATGDGALPERLTVSATFELDDLDARAGLVVVEASGTKVGVLLSGDGRLSLIRDALESFDVLGSGSADLGDGRVHVSLSVGPDGTSAMIDGRVVVSMQEHLAPAAFGIAVWSQQEPATIVVDDFEVRATPSE